MRRSRRVADALTDGVSAQGGCFSENVLKKMAALHAQPVILALSNPTHKVLM